MTPAEEARFIALWTAGTEQAAMAQALGIPRGTVAPATPAVERKDIQQWTVRLSTALIEHLKAVAYERRIPPSQLVEELVWKSLMDHHPSKPGQKIICISGELSRLVC